MFELLAPAAGGAATGVVCGAVALAAAVAGKAWLDRDLLRPRFAEARERRQEARDQVRALNLAQQAHNQGRVQKNQPGAGQFTGHARSEGTPLA